MKKIILIVLIAFAAPLHAQQLTRILFVFDASNSMNGKWEGATKIEHARRIFSETINQLEGIPNLEVALRVYGHQSPITPTFQDCNDTKLEVPFGPNNFAAVKGFIQTVECKGTTPIARSLELSADDFPDANSRNIIILITDGLEACDEFPCESARKLKEKGINVTPFVVGLGIDLEYLKNFECIGRVYEANTLQSFENVMNSVIFDALMATSVQINLNDIHGKPTETNVTVFLYEAGTKNLKYTFMHTLNVKNNPDTIVVIDPKLKYDVVVNTLPKVEVKGISIIKGTHNIIPADCPQGKLQVRIKGPTKTENVNVRVMQNGQSVTLNVQSVNDLQNYIVGTYDLEILTLPRLYFDDVKINQSDFTYIDIPGSGILKYTASKAIVGQIFLVKEGQKDEWVCDIDPSKLTDQFYLQPGFYKLVYRIKSTVSTDYTATKPFQIMSGENTLINL
ncbi:MAG: VWA domain-containing protein [Crocinitomicaceae bacterium]|nr:VWA domain-containing protein [Crocinitomicaceae bacterium]